MSGYDVLLYNEVNLVTLVLLCIVLNKTAVNNDIKSKRPSFMGFIVSLIVLTVGDIVWAFVEGKFIPKTTFWMYFTNLVYFVGTLVSVYFLFMVYEDTLGYEGNYRKKSLLIGIPFAAALVFVMLTPITHLVFSCENGNYQRTSLYTATLAIPYGFVIYLCASSLIRSYMPKYYSIRRSLRIMTLYSLITLLLSFVQLVSTETFPLYPVGGAFICLMIYIDSVNELSTVDPLTGLQTRRAFENRVSNLMNRECEAGKSLYILMADLDDFKSLNEIYGHDEGNQILADAAKIIRQTLPESWMCARFGGDEFAMTGVCESDEADAIITHIATAFEEYNLASSKPYTVTVSTCVAALSYTCKSVDDFIHLAVSRLDEACAITKSGSKTGARGKNGVAKTVVTQKMENGQTITQQDINLWMSSALKNGEFVPYYQPQVNVQTGTVSGTEALARWDRPGMGLIYPSVFIPVFERNGFIYEMDKAIWYAVCKQIRQWKDEGQPIPPISVNVSRWDIVQNDFAGTILSYLNEFRLRPTDLRLEITESAYLFDQDYLIRLMGNLQEYGFEIEMDDFGSGYSSLTAFKDLPFDLIKLDASLIRESTTTQKAGSILEGIARLTNSMNMPVIAEGVEYREQADFLQKIGCMDMQGYLFAKPMPADKYIEFVRDWQKNTK